MITRYSVSAGAMFASTAVFALALAGCSSTAANSNSVDQSASPAQSSSNAMYATCSWSSNSNDSRVTFVLHLGAAPNGNSEQYCSSK